MTQEYYRPSEAAKLLQVSIRTVTSWFDEGTLEGFRLPTRKKERRYSVRSVVEFMRENGYPDELVPEIGD